MKRELEVYRPIAYQIVVLWGMRIYVIVCHLRLSEPYVSSFEISDALFYAIVAIGVAAPIGLVAGMIPGVGGKVALAVFAPLLSSHQPAGALMLLLTLHAVVRLGGALPAIVLGVPGSSADAAMTVHGHALAGRGEYSRAVALTCLGGALSGVVGIWLFVAIAVSGSSWLTEMTPSVRWGLFMAAFLLIVMGESSRRLLAVFVLGLGIFFSSASENSEEWRLPILPMMLGLLVVPQLLAQAGTNEAPQFGVGEKRKGSFRSAWQDLLNHRLVWTACAALGWICGLAPGVGATAISWMALTLKRLMRSNDSSEQDSDIAGVVAPIAGTMSKEGGSLVTTLLLGIPGSTAMIIMLSVFQNDVIPPGSPQSLVTGSQFIMIGSVVSLGIGVAAMLALPLARQLARVRRLPSVSLRRTSLLLVVLSVIVADRSLAALLVLVFAGALGTLMDRLSVARIPLIIGVILGTDAVALTLQVWF